MEKTGVFCYMEVTRHFEEHRGEAKLQIGNRIGSLNNVLCQNFSLKLSGEGSDQSYTHLCRVCGLYTPIYMYWDSVLDMYWKCIGNPKFCIGNVLETQYMCIRRAFSIRIFMCIGYVLHNDNNHTVSSGRVAR